jgi:hypothetical protein
MGIKNEELRMKGVCGGENKTKSKELLLKFKTAYLKIREPISFFILHFSFFALASKHAPGLYLLLLPSPLLPHLLQHNNPNNQQQRNNERRAAVPGYFGEFGHFEGPVGDTQQQGGKSGDDTDDEEGSRDDGG